MQTAHARKVLNLWGVGHETTYAHQLIRGAQGANNFGAAGRQGHDPLRRIRFSAGDQWTRSQQNCQDGDGQCGGSVWVGRATLLLW